MATTNLELPVNSRSNSDDLRRLLAIVAGLSGGTFSDVLAKKFSHEVRPITLRGINRLMSLAGATGSAARDEQPNSFTCVDVIRRIDALPPTSLGRDGFASVIRHRGVDAIGDADVELLFKLAQTTGGTSGDDLSPSTQLPYLSLACSRCGTEATPTAVRATLAAGNAGCDGCGEQQLLSFVELDAVGGDPVAQEPSPTTLALIEWLYEETLCDDCGGAISQSMVEGTSIDADDRHRRCSVSEDNQARCLLCDRACRSCHETAGITELIHFPDQNRTYHCTSCGQTPLAAGNEASITLLGECPRCGSVERVEADRVIECVNGHSESENKFLVAAAIGLPSFTCRVCQTAQFRFRHRDDH